MKKCTAVILAVLVVLSCVCLSSCGDDGLNYYKISDIKEGKIEGFPKLSFLNDFIGSGEAYVAEIKDDAPAEVVVPSEKDEKPVVALMSAPEIKGALNSIKIADGIQYIEKCCSKGADVVSLTIPKSVKSISDSYKKCTKLETLNVEGDIDTLENAFEKCSSLKEAVFEGKVSCGIEGNVFESSESLEKLTFKGYLKSISASSSDYKSLKELSFKDKADSIGESAFSGCENLEAVEFSGEVGTINKSAFSGCSNLNSVKFDKKVYKIDENAFSGCEKLETVEFSADVDSIGREAFTSLGVKNLDVKGKVGEIGLYAFKNCDSLNSIVFRKDVSSIDAGAFDNCDKLKNVEFKGRAHYLSYISFGSCPSLKSIIVKNKKDTDLQMLEIGKIIGTRKAVNYLLKIPSEKILKKAKKKVGKKLPSGKQISIGSARKLAKKYNGPLISMITPANCYYTKYSRKYAKRNGKLVSMHMHYLGELKYKYHNTVYTDKKAKKFLKGKAPLVYCLAEQIGYSGPKVYKSINTTRNITRKYYFRHYRFSFWNYKTGKLIAWFTYKSGYAPFRYNLSDEYKITQTVDGLGNKRFFKEKDGKYYDSLNYVMKFVFGRKNQSRNN